MMIDTEQQAMTTEAQMRSRMHDGHRQVLRHLLSNTKGQNGTAGQIRGWVKSYRTLRRWGAIDDFGTVTEVGHRLLSNTTN